jgi:hypothetical protein
LIGESSELSPHFSKLRLAKAAGLPGGGDSARFHGDGVCKGPPITKGTCRGEARGDLVTEDISEFGADGLFVVVKLRGLH